MGLLRDLLKPAREINSFERGVLQAANRITPWGQANQRAVNERMIALVNDNGGKQAMQQPPVVPQQRYPIIALPNGNTQLQTPRVSIQPQAEQSMLQGEENIGDTPLQYAGYINQVQRQPYRRFQGF